MEVRPKDNLENLTSLVRLNMKNHKIKTLKQKYANKDRVINRGNKPNIFKDKYECGIRKVSSNLKQTQQFGFTERLVRKMRSGVKLESQKRAFRCGECPYTTDRKNNLKRHITTMHESCSKVLECCRMVFENKAALREHVVLRHRHGYLCEECGRNFCRKALLKRHVTVHSGQKDHVCEVCGYATSHKSNLDRHTRRHRTKGIHGGTEEDTSYWEKHITRVTRPQDGGTHGWSMKDTALYFLRAESERTVVRDGVCNIDNIALRLQDKYSKYLDGRLARPTNTLASTRFLNENRCYGQTIHCSPLAVLYDGQGKDPNGHVPDTVDTTDSNNLDQRHSSRKSKQQIPYEDDTCIHSKDYLDPSEREFKYSNKSKLKVNSECKHQMGYNNNIVHDDSILSGEFTDCEGWTCTPTDKQNISPKTLVENTEDINLESEQLLHKEHTIQPPLYNTSMVDCRRKNIWPKKLFCYRHRCDHGGCTASFVNQWDLYVHSLGGDHDRPASDRPAPQRPLSLHIRTLQAIRGSRRTSHVYL